MQVPCSTPPASWSTTTARRRASSPSRGQRDRVLRDLRRGYEPDPILCLLGDEADRRVGRLAADRRRAHRPGATRRALHPRVRDQRQGGRHRRTGAAPHGRLPECADESCRGRRRGHAREAFHRVEPRMGTRDTIRIPRPLRALGAGRAHRALERARLPRLHRNAGVRPQRTPAPARPAVRRADRHRRRRADRQPSGRDPGARRRHRHTQRPRGACRWACPAGAAS